jgi:hypothetical protein
LVNDGKAVPPKSYVLILSLFREAEHVWQRSPAADDEKLIVATQLVDRAGWNIYHEVNAELRGHRAAATGKLWRQ